MKGYSSLSAAKKAIVVELFCKARDYQPMVNVTADDPGTPNPETPLAFFTRLCNEYPVRVALEQRAREAEHAARIAGLDDSDL